MSMTPKYKCLYEITGRIEDVNTFLVPAQDLPKQWTKPIEEVLRGAMAWGCVYGQVIPNHQWPELRDQMVKQFAASIANQEQGELAVKYSDIVSDGGLDRLRKALVYVAHALHSTPQYMLAKGIALLDNDAVRVSIDGWVVEASDKTTEAAHGIKE
jgi:hypothetical protein